VTSKTIAFHTQSKSLQCDYRYNNVLRLLLIGTDIQTNRMSRCPLSYYLHIHPTLCTNPYRVKLHSDMFRWRPPPPSSGKTTPRPQNKTIFRLSMLSSKHTFIARPLQQRVCLCHISHVLYVRCKYF